MQVLVRPRRSALYMPASNARALEKARTLPCDVVILDLEDSVAPEAKADARAAAVRMLRTGGFGRRELVVRVNGLDTPWGSDDLDALVEAPPDAVLVPKVSDGGEIARYEARLARFPEQVALWAMVETCHAILRLEAIASAAGAVSAGSSRLACLVMGTNDLAEEMGCDSAPDRAPLQAALALTVTAARAHGLAALDGVFNALEDEAGFVRECRQGRAFGFDGKTLIHPRQIEPCRRAFTPSEAEIAWARAVVSAFAAPEHQASGAIRVEGRMVERLHLARAERILASADAR